MLREALASGELVTYLPNYLARAFPVFLTYRQGARRIARIDATISTAEEHIPKLLSG